jgi:Iap family predicted aminopeptidase
VLLCLGISVAARAQTGDVKIATEDEIKAEVKIATCKNDDRLEAVRKIFRDMGAPEDTIKTEKYKDVDNLVVMRPGKTSEKIIIGAHYDKVPDGCGAIDNWTGIVILANLYRSIKSLGTNKTYVFVAFGKEEVGLVGSRAMAKSIQKEDLASYCAMVNFDSFGFNFPRAMANTSSSGLIKEAAEIAKKMDVPFSAWTVDNADADSSSFKAKGIPSITLTGLSNNWPSFLHSSNDKADSINSASVYVGYRFALSFLVSLDAADCQSLRK